MTSLGVALADLVYAYTGYDGAIREIRAAAGDGVMEVDYMVFDQDGLNILAVEGGRELVVRTVTVHLSDKPVREPSGGAST